MKLYEIIMWDFSSFESLQIKCSGEADGKRGCHDSIPPLQGASLHRLVMAASDDPQLGGGPTGGFQYGVDTKYWSNEWMI